MPNIPDDFHYASTHEWIKVDENGLATVGISEHAQEALGDIVFVELPEPGAKIEARAEVAVVESVKAASDIYSPVGGEITEVNEALIDNPQLVNTAPCEDGCNRNEVDDHVGINAVEHFIGNYALEHGLKLPPAGPDSGKKVAIIGGGPAGLACAYHLRRRGHACTIFEGRRPT